LFKLARKFGHDEGRFEILTAINSFHGRTLAGIAATGQDKVKMGFEPMTLGFRHVPFNDLETVRKAISPATAAILIEGVQGEGGITPATPEYLRGLRRLCDEKNMLLFLDEVQCGYFRTGRFLSFQRILEGGESQGDEASKSDTSQRLLASSAPDFLPDGISMAKALGGGFPMGAFWLRAPYADLLGPGTHATTFGGTPLACAVALRVFEVVEQEQLADNVRQLGEWLKRQLEGLAAKYPRVIQRVRGLGLMLGIELAEKEKIPALAANNQTAATQFVNRLHQLGVMTIPAGAQVVRLLPPLNLKAQEAAEGIAIIEEVAKALA